MKQAHTKGGRRASPGRGRLSAALFPLLAGLSVWAAATARWEARHWDNLKMNEVVNQLSTPVEGTGSAILGEFWGRCVLPGVLAAVIAAAVVAAVWRRPWRRRAARWASAACALFLAGMLVYGWVLLDVTGYIRDSLIPSNYIEEEYADPRTAELTFPEQKRNLIYIYLESMESTFADTGSGGAFPETVIPELTALADEGVSFTGRRGGVNGGCSMAGSTWTMGAMFAQTSGLPLKIPITDSSMSSQTSFFPGVVTLGDILAENGYRQALLLGSKAVFGGRELYFKEHGSYEIWDYNWAVETGRIPEDYYVWWGYEDEKLFSFAREQLAELAAGDQPFNLTLLTVDTHFPDGYVCPLCEREFGDDQYSNVLSCSSRQVAAFVDWLSQQSFYENTTVVLTGDHITMDVGYCDDVPADYQRKVYTTILNPAAEVKSPGKFREYTTMDLFPTTLAALGVDIPGDRLGLGTNLFSRRQTLLERDGFDRMNTQLQRRSDFMNRLSGIDEAVFRLSEELEELDTELAAEFSPEGIAWSVRNLAPYAQEFTRLEVFEEIVVGNTRTTLCRGTAERGTDDVWRVTLPYDKLNGAETFTVNLYVTTAAGRIRVDAGYLCDRTAGTLTRLPSAGETEGTS